MKKRIVSIALGLIISLSTVITSKAEARRKFGDIKMHIQLYTEKLVVIVNITMIP